MSLDFAADTAASTVNASQLLASAKATTSKIRFRRCRFTRLKPSQRVCQAQPNLSETGVAKAHMFTGWRVRPRWAAALLIRSRKDLLERLRDHAVAGSVRMEVEDRAHPRPLADPQDVERNAVHERPVCRRECGFDVGNRDAAASYTDRSTPLNCTTICSVVWAAVGSLNQNTRKGS
jgi:hypothetical protein